MTEWNPTVFVQTYKHEQQQQAQQPAVMLNMRLEPTSEQVWPEDEAAEFASVGGSPFPFMADDQAEKVLRAVNVQLPDLLTPVAPEHWLRKGPLTTDLMPELEQKVPGREYVAFQIPTSYSSPSSVILRRLRLEILLSSDGGVKPVVAFMNPRTKVDVNVLNVGEFGLNLGKVSSAVFPQMPPVITANIKTKIDLKKIHPSILADGLKRRNCRWLISDSQIAYDFNPVIIAQYSKSHTLTVSAWLFVEVRKGQGMFGVFHRTYGKSTSPMLYVYRPGQPDMVAFDYLEQLKDLESSADGYRFNATGSSAFYRLGELYEDRNPAEAEKWYERAADVRNQKAMVRLGELVGERDRAAAERWYQLAASGGDSGLMYRIGQKLEKQDRTWAEEWYRRAADAKNIDAMLRLGQLYEGQDEAKAEEWYRQAVKIGGHKIMYRIGQILEEEDQARAEEWYRRAADAKDNDAMLRLGQLSEGRSRAEAAMWYRRAADRGSEKARMALKRIYPWRYFISIKYRRRHRRRRTSHWR